MSEEIGFLERAEGVLEQVQTAVEAGAPVDVQWDRSGDTFSIELAGGMRYVMSINKKDERIFCSAEGEGLTFHFQPDDGDWCSADGRELFSFLTEHFGQRTGVELDL